MVVDFLISDEDWEGVSNGAKNLIRKMLTLNPKKRITAQDALQDLWITNNQFEKPLNKNILDNLTNFQVRIVNCRVKVGSGM